MTTKMTPEIARTLSAAEQHEWFRSVTSRRSLLRGGLVGAGAVAAGPTLLGGISSAAAGAPDARPSAPLLKKADRPIGAIGRAVRPPRRLRRQARPSRCPSPGSCPALVNQPVHPGRHVAVRSRAPDRRRPSGADHPARRHRPDRLGATVADRPRSCSTTCRRRSPACGPARPTTTSVGHDGWDDSSHLDTVRSFTTAPLRSFAVHLHRLRRPGRDLRLAGQRPT